MYDAIVVGARCAGSPVAMLLARRGYRILLLDRASFPSNSMRNHFIQQAGTMQLHRWGILPAVVESNCPPVRTVVSDFGDFPLREPVEVVDGMDATYAPRRLVLDKILVDGAVAAGAELREKFAVQELLWRDGRVVGVRGRENGGANVDELARIVIGADGAHSAVAEAVQAPRYHERPVLTYAYYSYFSGVPVAGLEMWLRPGHLYIGFCTNDDLTCVAMQAPVAGFRAFRGDIEGNFYRALDEIPELAERVRVGTREERWYGTADVRNFFRKPYGPGWALVGDAGYHKDPFLAQGISDAFRDAELLADAIDAGLAGRASLEESLECYERVRNEAAMPGYEQNCAAASFLPLPPEFFADRAAKRTLQPRSPEDRRGHGDLFNPRWRPPPPPGRLGEPPLLSDVILRDAGRQHRGTLLLALTATAEGIDCGL
jgi:flavin-dependent dehydrogenase